MLKWGGPIIAGIGAVAAALYMPLLVWKDLSNGLIAFFGFLAAAVVQVIPITANFLQSDRLTETEARRLSNTLERQQHYWLGLLVSTIFALVIVIFVSIATENTGSRNIQIGERHFLLTYAQVISGFIAFVILFVFARILGLIDGVLSLQRLRAQLVMNAAKRAAAEELERHRLRHEAAMLTSDPLVPSSYGEIVQPRH